MEDVPVRLVVLRGPNQGHEYSLTDEETFGRSATNSIVLPLPEISRRHARLWRDGDHYYLEDLGSTNGTFINQRRLYEPSTVVEGDEIQIGDTFQLLFTGETFSDGTEILTSKDRVEELQTIVDSHDAVQPAASYPQSEIPTPKPPLSTDLSDYEIEGETQDPESRGRRFVLWCGCLPLVLISLCMLTLLFLDSYQQGRLLYCGSLGPIFELVLGPFGYSPICP